MASKTVMERGERDKPEAIRYRALFRVAHAISAYRDPDDLFRALADEIRQAADYEFMSLLLYDEASHNFRIQLLETRRSSGIILPSNVGREETISWSVYQNQKPVVIPSTLRDERFPKTIGILRDNSILSACFLPLTTSRRRLGAIGFGMSREHNFTSDEVDYLGLVADQVALAAEGVDE